jgi:hypothetical protein
MLRKIRNQAIAQKAIQKRANDYRNLIRREAVIGGTVFGIVPKGRRRQFFCLDEHTWVWHEEWVDKLGQTQHQTTRYDVRPDTIVKFQEDHGYKAVSPAEARNLRDAAQLYYKRIMTNLYGQTA